MEFTNNLTTSTNPMQIGCFGEQRDDHQLPHQDESQGANSWDYSDTEDGRCWPETQQANGLGKGGGGGSSVQCFNCGGYGHIARNCPHTPAGKGKGNGKTSFGPVKGDWRNGKGKGTEQQQKGKGKGKGPRTGCYICGGAHYQSECPQKGGGKGLRTLDGWTQAEG